jgi:dTDP-4-dehydrorhamnose reductase
MSARPILVLGAGGQVGREVLARHRAAIGLSHRELDIRDGDRMMAAIVAAAPAVVINAAAYTAVDKAESERDLAFAVNRDGAANIAAACAARQIPLLHLSTDYVYDGTKTSPYVETDPVAPLGIYGASKLAGDEAVRARVDRHVILRTSWVFAADGVNFVRAILRRGRQTGEVRVVDDQHGGPTPAGAIAEALIAIGAALEAGNRAWGTYHFSGAPVTSWCGFARAIFAEAQPLLGKHVSVTPIATADYPTASRRPANSVLDCGKIKRVFGVGQPDWRGGLAGTIATMLKAEATA